MAQPYAKGDHMRRFIPIFILPLAVFLLGLFPTEARAQATRTWVSGVGDDANPCSRTAPCKTFAGAISKTATNGEINCIDAGGFGGVTITKAIAIHCDGYEAGVLVAFTNGIIVNVGATDSVTLSGLDMQGTGSGLNGVRFIAGGALHVQNSVIRNFRGAGGNGIDFNPSSGLSELFVTDTIISENGDGTNGNAILVRPTGTALARVVISRSTLANNTNGLVVDTGATAVSGTSRVTFADSVSAGNNTTSGNTGAGVKATAAAVPGGINRVIVLRSTIVNNGIGIASSGPGAAVSAALTAIYGNGSGLVNSGSDGLATYQNNFLNGNTGSDGTFTTTLSPQ